LSASLHCFLACLLACLLPYMLACLLASLICRLLLGLLLLQLMLPHGSFSYRYIYIENQYFLGSCYMWKKDQESGCSHSVIAELVKRIVSKIKSGQDFTAYIVRLYI
jgi:hypothetical protein